MSTVSTPLLVRKPAGLSDYLSTWQAMQQFTRERDQETVDELWLVQHPPVFTLGLAGKPEHLIAPSSIPVIPVDRGGQITYHGPGQIVLYLLLDLRRHHLTVKGLVSLMEQALLELLAQHHITGERLPGAPGIYVGGAKIAALGLRIQRGYSYHGLSLNVDLDLAPFRQINPCGFAGLPVTRTLDLGLPESCDTLATQLIAQLAALLRLDPVPA